MSEPTCNERRDDLAANSIGALELHERLDLERHVTGCETCTEYVNWLQIASDLLPISVAQQEPPPSLKRDLMREVREDVKADRRRAVNRKRAEQGLWGSIWRPVTALAATFVLVAGATGGYIFRGGEVPVDQAFIEAERTDPGVGPAMVATLERNGSDGTLHVDKLPGLPSDENYQAWIGRDGNMVPSTIFVVKNDGSNEVAIDGSLKGADGVYITREPEGGSESPTTPVILSASLG